MTKRAHLTAVTVAALLVLLTGCVRVAYEPSLPFPEKPAWRFFLCDTDKVCLTQADANKLNKWLDKVEAFRAGRSRLLESGD